MASIVAEVEHKQEQGLMNFKVCPTGVKSTNPLAGNRVHRI